MGLPEALEAIDPDLARRNQAAKVKGLRRITLPHLDAWNYGACARHVEAGPQVDCEWQACGGELFDHQSVTVTWLYLNGSGMVASVPGAGKTNTVLALAALLKQRHELVGRCVIVVQTPAVLQWLAEAHRFAPGLRTEAVYSGMTRAHRIERYVRNWDVLIIGFHMLLRDIDMLEQLDPKMLVTDDVDPLLDHDNLTHQVIARLSRHAERVVVMNASNLQTRLQQIHAAMVPMGGEEIWGTLEQYERRYIRTEPIRLHDEANHRWITVQKQTGYKNMEEYKARLSPWYIRHGYEDLTDVRMPEVMPPENVYLEMGREQRRLYEELRKGVLRLLNEEGGVKVQHVTALTAVGYGQQICAGVPALRGGDVDGPSAKLDWLMSNLDGGAWSDQKVVVFMKNKGMIRALKRRCDRAGIGYAVVWGEDRSSVSRRSEQQRFWRDPDCRVFMGTSAIERSLNLQAAGIVVNVDTHLNPERMRQILGRARRAGSRHSHVFVFNLFMADSQEDKYLSVLRRRAAVIDYVWEESNELYERLSARELLQLIRP